MQAVFCSAMASAKERVDDIMRRMAARDLLPMFETAWGAELAVGRPAHNIRYEGLHGLQAPCVNTTRGPRCPTIFPGGPSLGASFNRTSWAVVGSAIGDEARAYNNLGDAFAHAQKTGGFSGGLSLWLPNLNIYRDPRWGRNAEVASEDPFHAGVFGAELVRGVQGYYDGAAKSGGYVKIAASVKHLTAYSMETGRMSNNFNVSQRDMNETYLPAFEGAIAGGGAYG